MSSRIFKLSRSTSHRRALFRNQVTSLFTHERIQTTLAKAKALQPIADGMINQGKRGTTHAYRKCKAYLFDPMMVRKCFTEFAERYKFRPGGYTRIIRTQRRKIDNAEMAYIELVDRPDELRTPRAVGYEFAVRKGLVPPPLSPILTPEDLAIASAISPSTSNDVNVVRKHFLGIVPDHVTYYPKYTRSKTNIPTHCRGLTKIHRTEKKRAAKAQREAQQQAQEA